MSYPLPPQIKQCGHPEIIDLMREVAHMQNGHIAEAMKNMGLTYDLNYGVNIVQLRAMVKKTKLTKAQVIKLWEFNVREARLLAIFIMTEHNFTTKEIIGFSQTLNQLELVEHFSRHVIARTAEPIQIISTLMEGDFWQRLLSIYGAAWCVKLDASDKEKIIELALGIDDGFYHQHPFFIQGVKLMLQHFYALQGYKQKIWEWAEIMAQSNNESVKKAATEFLWLNS